jgi:hypothetical protein
MAAIPSPAVSSVMPTSAIFVLIVVSADMSFDGFAPIST